MNWGTIAIIEATLCGAPDFPRIGIPEADDIADGLFGPCGATVAEVRMAWERYWLLDEGWFPLPIMFDFKQSQAQRRSDRDMRELALYVVQECGRTTDVGGAGGTGGSPSGGNT